jgi:nitrate reductase NapE component
LGDAGGANTAALEARLLALDRNGDGELDLGELAAAVEALAEVEAQTRLLKWVCLVVGLFALVTVAVTGGLTYAVLRLSQDTAVDAGAALVAKGSGAAVETVRHLTAAALEDLFGGVERNAVVLARVASVRIRTALGATLDFVADAPAAAGGEGPQNAGRRLLEAFEITVDTQGFTVSGVPTPVAPFPLQVASGDTVGDVKEKITAEIKRETGAARATGFSPDEFTLVLDTEGLSPSGASLTSSRVLNQADPALTLADLRAVPYSFDIQGGSMLRMGNILGAIGNVNVGGSDGPPFMDGRPFLVDGAFIFGGEGARVAIG